jgi:hypothetical protein
MIGSLELQIPQRIDLIIADNSKKREIWGRGCQAAEDNSKNEVNEPIASLV